MANETKIGLLVGMCFIVCFAIILSHRGAPRGGEDAAQFEIADIIRDAPPPVLEPPAGTTQHAVRSAARQRDRVASRPRAAARPAADAGFEGGAPRQTVPTNDFMPAPASATSDRFRARGPAIVVPTPSHTANTAVVLPTLDAGPPTGEPLRLNMPEPSRQPAAQPPIEQTMQPWTQASQQMAEALAYAREQLSGSAALSNAAQLRGAAATEQPVADTERSAAKLIGTHEVAAGDTLSRIAREHYGSADKAIIDAIYATNRERMKNPDHLEVGWALALPEVGTAPSTASSPTLAQMLAEAGTDVSGVEAAAPRFTSSAPAATYEVQPGDALSRIAERHYGTSKGPIMQAILTANADWLKDADHLVAGRTLLLPVVAQADPPSSSTGRAEVQPDEPAVLALGSGRGARGAEREQPSERAAAEADWRWYQLKKGEVYSTVAASQMGSAGRWKELAELNRDIFPNPDRIRYGVRIRVPVAGSRTPTSQTAGEGA